MNAEKTSALRAIIRRVAEPEFAFRFGQDLPPRAAPRTAAEVMADAWTHAYTRAQAAFPLPYVAAAKYWPPVKRVDNVYGDRNLICTCDPLEAYAQAAE